MGYTNGFSNTYSPAIYRLSRETPRFVLVYAETTDDNTAE